MILLQTERSLARWRSGDNLGLDHEWLFRDMVEEHYRTYPAPRDRFFVYHGEVLGFYSWYCGNHDVAVPIEYCQKCDDIWSTAAEHYMQDKPASARRKVADIIGENPAWQMSEVVFTPCNFPNNGYLGHTECKDDDHHFAYDLHMTDAEYYRLLEERSTEKHG